MSSGGFYLPPHNNVHPNTQSFDGYPDPHQQNQFVPNGWNATQQEQPGYYPQQLPYPAQGVGGLINTIPHQIPLMLNNYPCQPQTSYPSTPAVPFNNATTPQAPPNNSYPSNTQGNPTAQSYGNTTHFPGHPAHQMYAGGSKIELSLYATNLKDMDVFSKSDPRCVLFEKRSGNWVEIDRTETISNNLNPIWEKKFYLNYNPQSPQELKFEIYDWDTNSTQLNRQDFLGRTEISLGTILTSPGKQLSSFLKDGGGGKITILSEEINPNARGRVSLQLAGNKLDRMDFIGSSDPYYLLSKKMQNGQWALVYKSEVIKNNCNPKWKVMDKSVAEICNGDYQRELKIEIFDYDSTSKDDIIGEFVTNLRSLSNSFTNHSQHEVINLNKQRNKRKYKNSGTVYVLQCNLS